MKTSAFLATLRERDIQVWADGERLRCNAPSGLLTAELRDELQQRKQDILEFLTAAESLAAQQRALIPLQPRGIRPPIFAVAGHNGDVFCYRALVQHLGEEQPLFGLQPPGLDDQSEPLWGVEDLAAYFVGQIRAFLPEGPFIIAGYCAGGGIAFELARQLLGEGAQIGGLVLLGAPYPTFYHRLPQFRQRLVTQFARITRHARALASLTSAARQSYVMQKLQDWKAERAKTQTAAIDPVRLQRGKVERATLSALSHYTPTYFDGPLSLLVPSEEWAHAGNQTLRWRSTVASVEENFGPSGCHTDIMLLEPHVGTFAELLTKSLTSAFTLRAEARSKAGR